MNKRKSIVTLGMATIYFVAILLFSFSNPLSNKLLSQNTQNHQYKLGFADGIPSHTVVDSNEYVNFNWNFENKSVYSAPQPFAFNSSFLALKDIDSSFPEVLSSLQNRIGELLYPFHSFW